MFRFNFTARNGSITPGWSHKSEDLSASLRCHVWFTSPIIITGNIVRDKISGRRLGRISAA